MTGSQNLYLWRHSRFLLFSITLAWTARGLAQDVAADNDWLSIQPEIICRAKINPRDTLCPKLSHFRLNLHVFSQDRLSLQLAWDPGHQRKPTWYDSYDVFGQQLPPRSSWLSRYALRWRFADDLELNIENWSAATLIPDASGLAFAQSLQDSGWEQSVLRLTFIKPQWNLPAFSLIAGLSEGERRENRDGKPYLGILSRWRLFTAIEFQAGGSYDTDGLAPDALFWLNSEQRERASQGFLTKRAAWSFILDGHHPLAQGLRLSLGEQYNTIHGLNKDPWPRLIGSQEGPLDPTELLAEPLGGQTPVERRTRSMSASYLLLAQYLLAFHQQILEVRLGYDTTLSSCATLDLDGSCQTDQTRSRSLHIKEQTFGLGRVNPRGWNLFFEYHTVRYDKLYELYHFAPAQNSRQRDLAILQSRVTWNW